MKFAQKQTNKKKLHTTCSWYNKQLIMFLLLKGAKGQANSSFNVSATYIKYKIKHRVENKLSSDSLKNFKFVVFFFVYKFIYVDIILYMFLSF